MKKLNQHKGGKNVTIEAFLASLMNDPWLVEEAWLENLISILQESSEESASALLALKKENDAGSSQIVGDKAVIPIHGPIFAQPNFVTEFLGIGCVSSKITQDIQSMLKDDSVESIILDVDSPGGTVTGTNQLSSVISNGTKDITAYVGGTGASAAYWLASGAKEIILDDTARVGSIGVVAAYPLPQKDGRAIEMVNTASPNKRPDVSTDKGKKVVIQMLDDLADVFINTVAKNRNVDRDTVLKDFGKGGMLVGQKAVDVGMADRVGSLGDLLGETPNSNDSNNFTSETKGDSSMDLKELKAKHKDLYDAIVASVKEEAEASNKDALTAKDAEIAAKDAEITSFKDKLEASEASNATMEDRVKSLEKQDTLRSERDMKNTSAVIMSEKLAASSLPERLHPKISALVDYNKFMKEGKLDYKTFADAVEAEIKEWEETMASDDFIQGPSAQTFTSPSGTKNDIGDEEAIVDRMSGYLNN